nr:MAG TPA: hypothetical protein [Caudoviricetes sp.]
MELNRKLIFTLSIKLMIFSSHIRDGCHFLPPLEYKE